MENVPAVNKQVELRMKVAKETARLLSGSEVQEFVAEQLEKIIYHEFLQQDDESAPLEQILHVAGMRFHVKGSGYPSCLSARFEIAQKAVAAVRKYLQEKLNVEGRIVPLLLQVMPENVRKSQPKSKTVRPMRLDKKE